MSQSLAAVATAAAYPTGVGGCQLGPNELARALDLDIANAGCFLRLYRVADPTSKTLRGNITLTDEIPIAGPKTLHVDRCLGFQAKDRIPGTHATIDATLWDGTDPVLSSAVQFNGTLTPSGGFTPPAINNVTPGNATVTWPGGSVGSTAITVTHGLPATPNGISCLTFGLIGVTLPPVFEVLNIGATSFDVRAFTVDAQTPALGATCGFYWLAAV